MDGLAKGCIKMFSIVIRDHPLTAELLFDILITFVTDNLFFCPFHYSAFYFSTT